MGTTLETKPTDLLPAESLPAERARIDARTLAAFAAMIFLIAANVVAVRFSTQALPPFWGAGTRFLAASLVFFAYVFARRLPLKGGRAFGGAVLYGLLQFGLAFALMYWAIQEVSAGVISVLLALIPLFTFLLAFLARLEPFRLRGLLGSLVAVAGIAVIFGGRASDGIPLLYLLAGVGGALVFSLAGILVKKFPPAHPAFTNAVGMLTGGLLLLDLSAVTREPAVIPADFATWATFIYLVLPGSVGLFGLLLLVLKRWPASVVAYQTVLSPIVAIALSAWLLQEPLTGGLFLGSALVLAGVYVGVIAKGRQVSRP